MDTQEYIKRRRILREQIKTGKIILFGNRLIPRNYTGNPLPFRQDSSFLYYVGIDTPNYFFLLDCDNNEEILFGDPLTIDDQIWSGPQLSLQNLADKAGIKKVLPASDFNSIVSQLKKNKQEIHYLPAYPTDRQIFLSKVLEIPVLEISNHCSTDLIQAIVEQRSVKSETEIDEIEKVLNNVTLPMHIQAMKMAFPGIYEYEIVAEMTKIVKGSDLEFAYSPICSVHGEILHNEHHTNKIREGQLLLIDAGAESNMHYASDITRTIPVGGKFSMQQKEIYGLVLAVEEDIIRKIKPGIKYADLHHQASLQITKGLINLGIMKGEPEDAVEAGAHALFFPHGLGHMMGLDVHDMEDLGENYVGYEENMKRSDQFGTANLRLSRTLQPGFVLTVEPGIYFIPILIDIWQSDKKFEEFINYSKLEAYKNFGGIRIEDNVLVKSTGYRVLGSPIPKSITEVEQLMTVKMT